MIKLGTYQFKLASIEIVDLELANTIKAAVDAEIAKTAIGVDQKWFVRVVGHACDTPIVSEMAKARWETNMNLSADRASAVALALVKAGIDPAMIVVNAAGQSRPIGSDKNVNRRVNVELLTILFQ